MLKAALLSLAGYFTLELTNKVTRSGEMQRAIISLNGGGGCCGCFGGLCCLTAY